MNYTKIYFLDFTFDPKARTLQKKQKKTQLRKKEADVLMLLCDKYPEPVSQHDFLAGAWEGGYVTSQSIAQIIRSLRISLGDTNKNIIVTIPKLGYQFRAAPSYKKPETGNYAFREITQCSIKTENVTFRSLSKKYNTAGLFTQKREGEGKKNQQKISFSRSRKGLYVSVTLFLTGLLMLILTLWHKPIT